MAAEAQTGGKLGRSTGRLLLFVALLVALVWLAIVFAGFHEGEWVETTRSYSEENPWGYDLNAYLTAAERLRSEGSLYSEDLVSGTFEPGAGGLYYYAPPVGAAVLPLTSISFAASSTFWYVLHVLSFMAACALMPVRGSIRIAVFVTGAFSIGVIEDLVVGNVSVLLLLPLAVAWRWLDRPLGAVAEAMAIWVRPTLGVLLIWQLLRRQWTAVLWIVGVGCGIALLSLPFVGFDGYVDYVRVLSNMDAPIGFFENRELGSLPAHLGLPAWLADPLRLAGTLAAFAAILLSLRRDREVGFVVTIMASLLIVPQLWDHHLAMLVIPAAFLADRWRSVFVLLPLAAWLPPPLLPLVVMAAMALPFAVPDRSAGTQAEAANPDSGRLWHHPGR